MTLTQGVFITLAGMALLGAVGMVTLRNLLHSVLAMILTFVSVAGVFVLLEAEFLAMVQILIYVGAVAILILFGVMLTRDIAGRRVQVRNSQWVLALAAAAGMLAVLGIILARAAWPLAGAPAPIEGDLVAALGRALVGPYALPFEVASVLLLAALIGAIIIAREGRT